MILNNKDEELNLVFRVKVDGFDYVVNSGTVKCFGCGGEGHLVRACPEKTLKRAEHDRGHDEPGQGGDQPVVLPEVDKVACVPCCPSRGHGALGRGGSGAHISHLPLNHLLTRLRPVAIMRRSSAVNQGAGQENETDRVMRGATESKLYIYAALRDLTASLVQLKANIATDRAQLWAEVDKLKQQKPAWLVKNSQNIFAAHESQSDGFMSSSNGASLLLEAGDKVFVRLAATSQVFDNYNHHSTFSGHLLFPIKGHNKLKLQSDEADKDPVSDFESQAQKTDVDQQKTDKRGHTEHGKEVFGPAPGADGFTCQQVETVVSGREEEMCSVSGGVSSRGGTGEAVSGSVKETDVSGYGVTNYQCGWGEERTRRCRLWGSRAGLSRISINTAVGGVCELPSVVLE
ncbi:hypothetical protein FQN60_006085 [Etheostoma spectabile]|uniref:CCHC-type domain-containing protein n=1 Tax=Etheostoma spectabile TaxID=54343 RepID=A0A5J5C9W6_9PERO|nr:hypothetical protein FQN60_006085 [Etheostoma spectabile]